MLATNIRSISVKYVYRSNCAVLFGEEEKLFFMTSVEMKVGKEKQQNAGTSSSMTAFCFDIRVTHVHSPEKLHFTC